jgi:hypothetical protein
MPKKYRHTRLDDAAGSPMSVILYRAADRARAGCATASAIMPQGINVGRAEQGGAEVIADLVGPPRLFFWR